MQWSNVHHTRQNSMAVRILVTFLFNSAETLILCCIVFSSVLVSVGDNRLLHRRGPESCYSQLGLEYKNKNSYDDSEDLNRTTTWKRYFFQLFFFCSIMDFCLCENALFVVLAVVSNYCNSPWSQEEPRESICVGVQV